MHTPQNGQRAQLQGYIGHECGLVVNRNRRYELWTYLLNMFLPGYFLLILPCRVTVPVMDQFVPIMDQFSYVNIFYKQIDPGIICVKSHFEGSNLQDYVAKFWFWWETLELLMKLIHYWCLIHYWYTKPSVFFAV